MHVYTIRPFCRKKVDNAYYLLLKKRKGEQVSIIQINEIGNDIVSLLERHVPLQSIFEELSKEYEISNEMAESVLEDIRHFLSVLMEFGLLVVAESVAARLGAPSNPASSNVLQIGMLERLYKEKGLLYKAFIEITYICNLRCRHCYRTEAVEGSTAHLGSAHMDRGMVLELLDQLEEEGVVEVYITGGEAFLHPDILDILEYASKKNFLTTVLTNGNVIADKCLAPLLSKMDLFDIRVSIYGDRRAHDRFTLRSGSFDKSMAALESIQESMGVGTAVYVATSESINDLDHMAETIKGKGINLSINPVITPTSEGALFPLEYRLSLRDYERLCGKYKALSNGSSCTAGISRLRITPFGDVDGCELLPNSTIGNLFESNLKAILCSERREAFVRFLEKLSESASCSKCSKRSFCNVCPGAFYLETGGWGLAPKYRCGMTDVKIQSFSR